MNDHLSPARSLACDTKKVDCVICGDTCDGVQLNPCGHRVLCLTCTFNIVQTGCPMCRASIDEIVMHPSRWKYWIEELVIYKFEMERRTLSEVLQIVVVGSSKSQKELFVELLKEKYPISGGQTNITDGEEKANGVTHASTTTLVGNSSSKLPTDFGKPIAEFDNKFEANIFLSGTGARVTVLPCSDYTLDVHEEVSRLKPDVVVVCVSTETDQVWDELNVWCEAVAISTLTQYRGMLMPAPSGQLAGMDDKPLHMMGMPTFFTSDLIDSMRSEPPLVERRLTAQQIRRALIRNLHIAYTELAAIAKLARQQLLQNFGDGKVEVLCDL